MRPLGTDSRSMMRRRNRRVRAFQLAIMALLLVGLVLPLFWVSVVRATVLAAACGLTLVVLVIRDARDRRALDLIENQLGEHAAPEPAEPILPFAPGRSELVASLIALGIIAAVFVLYFGGYFGKMFGH